MMRGCVVNGHSKNKDYGCPEGVKDVTVVSRLQWKEANKEAMAVRFPFHHQGQFLVIAFSFSQLLITVDFMMFVLGQHKTCKYPTEQMAVPHTERL